VLVDLLVSPNISSLKLPMEFIKYRNAVSVLKNLPCKINFRQNWYNTKLPFRKAKIRLQFLIN
jgi:hypothetical protein